MTASLNSRVAETYFDDNISRYRNRCPGLFVRYFGYGIVELKDIVKRNDRLSLNVMPSKV